VAKRYVIQKIGLRSAGKLGLALGMLGSLLPACLLALLTRLAVTGVRQAYEAAAQARFSVLGQNIPLNLVDLARQSQTLETLRSLDALGWFLSLLVAVGWTVAGGLAIAATVLLLTAGFNLLAAVSGGLEVQAFERTPRKIAHRPPPTPERQGLGPPRTGQSVHSQGPTEEIIDLLP
jgi:hypothetical protein